MHIQPSPYVRFLELTCRVVRVVSFVTSDALIAPQPSPCVYFLELTCRVVCLLSLRMHVLLHNQTIPLCLFPRTQVSFLLSIRMHLLLHNQTIPLCLFPRTHVSCRVVSFVTSDALIAIATTIPLCLFPRTHVSCLVVSFVTSDALINIAPQPSPCVCFLELTCRFFCHFGCTYCSTTIPLCLFPRTHVSCRVVSFVFFCHFGCTYLGRRWRWYP